MQIGCDANGIMSDVILKNLILCCRFHARILSRHMRLSDTDEIIRSSEYDLSLNVLPELQPIPLLMQGYPIFI